MKSAYHVLDDEKNQEKTQQRGEGSSSGNFGNQINAIWCKIWKLPCQPKVRHFLWRLARNSLALKMNIQRRGVKLDTRCPVCHRLDEDGGHCFLKKKYSNIFLKERCVSRCQPLIRCLTALKGEVCVKISTVDSTQLPHLTNLAATADGRLCSPARNLIQSIRPLRREVAKISPLKFSGSRARSNFELANGSWASDRALLHGGPLRAP